MSYVQLMVMREMKLPLRVALSEESSDRTPSVKQFRFISVASHLKLLLFCVLNLFLLRTQSPFNVS